MNTVQQPPPGAGYGRSREMCVREAKAERRAERPLQLHVAGSSRGAHVYARSTSSGGRDVARRRCRPQRSSFVAAVTFGAVLVGAAAASSGSRNPPPPPPPPPSLGHQNNNNNGRRQEDRWVGWTPPPPGPPPDPDGGVGGEGAEVAWGAGTQGSYPLQGTAAGQQQGDGPVCEDGPGRQNGAAPPGRIMDRTQQEHAAGATGMAPGEAQRQAHERMSMMGQQPGRVGPSPPAYPQQQQQQYAQQQQHERQQQVPPPWGQNGAQQLPHQQDQFYDEANDMAGTNGHNNGAPPTTPQAPVGGFLNRRQMDTAAGMGMMGGAGAGVGASAGTGGGGADGGGGGARWEPPSAARAGAVTPEVRGREPKRSRAEHN